MSEYSHHDIGRIGEDATVSFLKNKGFQIFDRNAQRKWGELDIVALKDKVIHFVEVKSMRCRAWPKDTNRFRPEENMHPAKIKKLERTLLAYLLEHGLEESEWQLDLSVVLVNTTEKRSRVELLEAVY